jgi:hypothetical protein
LPLSNLRSALPMNIKARFVGFKAWAGARADIDRAGPLSIQKSIR